MTKREEPKPSTEPAEGPAGRLDSWKEIASFLGRGVRTVQRWEREEQLPVHRLQHAKRGTVYANREELARWWDSRQTTLAAKAAPPMPPPTPAIRGTPATLPRVERLTNTSAFTFSPALSSDARMFVYISTGGTDEDGPQVWLQQVGGAAMRLTETQRECSAPSFTADDTSVLFTARTDASLNVYSVPTLGGEARLVKRNAANARVSPDGRWLAYLSLESPRGVGMTTADGGDDRVLAADLLDASAFAWSPDGRHLLVRAHADPRFEPDFWVVPIDGSAPANTGVIEQFRTRGTVLDSPPVWIEGALVFSGAGRDGALLWRQPLAPGTFRAVGEPEPLTRGTEWASFPAAAGRRLVFVNAHADMNLWSARLEPSSGVMIGSPQRVTRGPGILGHLCLAADTRTLTYFSTRAAIPSLFVHDLATGSDALLAAGTPQAPKAFPAISPDGRRLAFATMTAGPRAMRPIFIQELPSGEPRMLCEDAGGRPRQWIDNGSILVETFGSRLNELVIVDAATAEIRPLVASGDRSVTNPRISSDSRWIAFDAASPGASPTVYVASLAGSETVSASDWMPVAQSASHPFWSSDGTLLYFLPTVPNRDLRCAAHGRRFDPAAGRPTGDVFAAASLTEGLVPAFIAGTAPIALVDRIVLVLADYRGDVWMMDL